MTLANQLKGNWGEQYVALRLAECGCLVRHVPQGHDSGIDLYVETTDKNGKPFLHCWLQVKTSQNFSITKAPTYSQIQAMFGGNEEFQEKLKYFLKQPIPVFVVCVPEQQGFSYPRVFVSSPLRLKDGQGISIPLEKTEEWVSFLKHELNEMTCEWDLSHGKCSTLKAPTTQYTRKFSSRPWAPTYKPELNRTIADTLFLLGRDILGSHFEENGAAKKEPFLPELPKERIISEAKDYIETLELFVTLRKEKHYHYYALIAWLAEVQGVFKKAQEFYQKCLAMIDQDSNLKPLPEEWEPVRASLEESLKRVAGKL